MNAVCTTFSPFLPHLGQRYPAPGDRSPVALNPLIYPPKPPLDARIEWRFRIGSRRDYNQSIVRRIISN